MCASVCGNRLEDGWTNGVYVLSAGVSISSSSRSRLWSGFQKCHHLHLAPRIVHCDYRARQEVKQRNGIEHKHCVSGCTCRPLSCCTYHICACSGLSRLCLSRERTLVFIFLSVCLHTFCQPIHLCECAVEGLCWLYGSKRVNAEDVSLYMFYHPVFTPLPAPFRFLFLYTTFSLFFSFSFKLSLCFSLHSLSSSSSLHLLPFVLPSPPPSVSYRSWQLPLTITQVGRHDNALMWSNINDPTSFPRAHNLFIYWNDSKAARACIYAAALC